MTAATVSRWARRYALVSGLFLVAWQAGIVVGISRSAEVILGVYGFVLHMVFGKAYSLVPTYFDRKISFPRAPAVQFPLVVGGTCALVGAALSIGPAWLGALGSWLWCLGVGVFLGSLVWTVRGNLTGRETATGSENADRRLVDRVANGFVPVALAYLFVGSYETLALHTGLPSILGGSSLRVSHLLAAGTAGTLLFALGFRLLPRFMVADPPRPLVILVLAAGALGPALLVTHFGGGPWFRLGAFVEVAAVVGFACGIWVLFARSDRRRVGFYGVLAGAASGVVGVALGLSFAFGRVSPSLVLAHFRLNILGFLGFMIVGMTFQFYPPVIGAVRGASDRTAVVSIAALAGGLAAQVVGLVGHVSLLTSLGQLSTLGGALLYVLLLAAVFFTQ